ncbi:MAG: hypothetical protein NXI01_00685 [Gammaproteobacteria bacterium]|nr:hypothetical protein [Gammaproteobacteria bacterium]
MTVNIMAENTIDSRTSHLHPSVESLNGSQTYDLLLVQLLEEQVNILLSMGVDDNPLSDSNQRKQFFSRSGGNLDILSRLDSSKIVEQTFNKEQLDKEIHALQEIKYTVSRLQGLQDAIGRGFKLKIRGNQVDGYTRVTSAHPQSSLSIINSDEDRKNIAVLTSVLAHTVDMLGQLKKHILGPSLTTEEQYGFNANLNALSNEIKKLPTTGNQYVSMAGWGISITATIGIISKLICTILAYQVFTPPALVLAAASIFGLYLAYKYADHGPTEHFNHMLSGVNKLDAQSPVFTNLHRLFSTMNAQSLNSATVDHRLVP